VEKGAASDELLRVEGVRSCPPRKGRAGTKTGGTSPCRTKYGVRSAGKPSSRSGSRTRSVLSEASLTSNAPDSVLALARCPQRHVGRVMRPFGRNAPDDQVNEEPCCLPIGGPSGARGIRRVWSGFGHPRAVRPKCPVEPTGCLSNPGRRSFRVEAASQATSPSGRRPIHDSLSLLSAACDQHQARGADLGRPNDPGRGELFSQRCAGRANHGTRIRCCSHDRRRLVCRLRGRRHQPGRDDPLQRGLFRWARSSRAHAAFDLHQSLPNGP